MAGSILRSWPRRTIQGPVPRRFANNCGESLQAACSVTTVSEDNGFTTFVGIPLSNYFTLSGYYNRSLRQHLDTVSFGITYVVRGTSRRKLSMIDKALREAEGANSQK